MKAALFALWLAAPVVWASWHFGPGQDFLKRDQSDAALARAKDAMSKTDYARALEQYDEALLSLPKEDAAQARRIRLARCQALVAGGQLPAGHNELVTLLTELNADPKAESAVVNGTREALGEAKYYLTWLMRLEGLTREVWEPEIESARQHFRHLAETGAAVVTEAPADVKRWQASLESAIRLSRMELTELQGLPLPSQCKGCKSCKNGKKPGKGSKKKEPQDSRAAGSGPPADGEGS